MSSHRVGAKCLRPAGEARSSVILWGGRIMATHRRRPSVMLARRQRDERDPSPIVGRPWLDLPLNVERQLLSEKQILRCELRVGPGNRGHEAEHIDSNAPKD